MNSHSDNCGCRRFGAKAIRLHEKLLEHYKHCCLQCRPNKGKDEMCKIGLANYEAMLAEFFVRIADRRKLKTVKES